MRTATKGKLLSIVKKLIEEENVDPNAEDSFGTSPVMIAASLGDVETLQFLLSLSDKVNINATDKNGITPLHLACYSDGFEEVVRALLGHPQIMVNKGDIFGGTPLQIACERGHETIVSLLLDREDIEVNKQQNEYKSTALMRACGRGNIEIVKSLLDHKDIDVNREDSNCHTTLVWACDKGLIDVISLLLQREDLQRTVRNIEAIVSFVMFPKPVVKVDKRAVIEEAVSKNLPDIARWLLKVEGYLASACTGSTALTGTTAPRRGRRPVMKRRTFSIWEKTRIREPMISSLF